MSNRAHRKRQQEIARRRVQSQVSKGLPAPRPTGQVQQGYFQQQVEHYNGPLPHPKILAQFDEIVPGAAARFLAEVETESAHRRSIEAAESATGRDGFKEQVRYFGRGQTMAFIIAITGMGVSVFTIYKGHPVEGVSFGVTVILALVVAFLKGAPGKTDVKDSQAAPVDGAVSKRGE